MPALKHSKQRDCIMEFLRSRTDHPTADTIYMNVRETMPNLSLGTVYRNLTLLTELGEIMKITTDDGADRFDGNPMPHHHFICRSCHSVYDLPGMENIDYIREAAQKAAPGQIQGYTANFYGICSKCLKKAGN